MRPAIPLTAAQAARLSAIRRADCGLGVPLPMANRLTVHLWTNRLIEPRTVLWDRVMHRMRYSVTALGRRSLAVHAREARELLAVPTWAFIGTS